MKKSSLITTIILISSFSISLAQTQNTQGYTPKVIPPLKKKKGLIETSTLLAHNGQWTLVPKGAVIYTPEHLKDKIITTPGKLKIVQWAPFLQKNHGWIHVHSITKEQARGKEKISEKAIKAYKTIGKMVVATYNGNPISVHPNTLKPEVKEAK